MLDAQDGRILIVIHVHVPSLVGLIADEMPLMPVYCISGRGGYVLRPFLLLLNPLLTRYAVFHSSRSAGSLIWGVVVTLDWGL